MTETVGWRAREERLKIVAQYGVGLDNIDRAAAAACGIIVTNTPLTC